jgi:hypothetical protein
MEEEKRATTPFAPFIKGELKTDKSLEKRKG